MKLPRDLSGKHLAQALCRDWAYVEIHQSGSHIILQTDEPSPHRVAEISSNLVRRVIDRVGARCSGSDLRYLQHSLQEPAAEASETLLVQTDGSMVAVRHENEAWKEVKLGVVVRSDHLAKKHKRGVVSQARYVPRVGDRHPGSIGRDGVYLAAG